MELRTEGWIAGLQLAALSLQGFDRDSEVTAFINRFTGNDRYIQDYLADEVLQQQTQETKDFLLHTSILNRMSASLCDTVTEKQNCQAVLDGLENANLFIVPLDNERRWFRYHHLFADLLYHRLTQTYPERIEKLHARASQWLEENGFQNQAIKHALAMEEKHLAADLIEKHALTFLYQGSTQVKAMLNWFDQLTEKVIRERPLLHIYKAWTLVFENPFKNKATVEQILSRVQGLLANIELSHSIERSVIGHIASIRGLLSQPPIQTDHDPHQVLALFQEAIRLFPPDEVKIRCNIHIGIAYEYMHLENTEAALKANQNAFTEAQSANNHLVAVVALRNQAMIKYYQGKLTQAVDLCQKEIFSFDQRDTLRNYPIPSLAILSIAKGYLLVERGELEKAETELAKGFETLQLYNEYETISLGHIAMSRLLLLKGETDKARQTIEHDKQRQPTQTTLLNVLSVQVALSCFENKSGALETIQNWARENQPQLEMEANFQGITPWAETRHLAHLTWIQAQIVLSRQETISSYKSVLLSCLDYLDQRLQTAEQNGIIFRVVECLVLKVLVLDVMGKSKDATDMLSQALSLAAPKGFCRVFLDKGQPMVQLLKGVSVQDYSIGFAHQLLAAFERLGDAKLSLLQQNMAEPLSEREQEVLQLVAQGLTNREISERLYLALDTVKGHNRRVFGKLGVQNRTEAVTCARELGILQTTDSK